MSSQALILDAGEIGVQVTAMTVVCSSLEATWNGSQLPDYSNPLMGAGR